jgi:hypothetical protein
MTRVPLIAAEGAVTEGGAAEDAEGEGAEAGHGVEQGVKGDAEQDVETARGKGTERTGPAEENPASDEERIVVAEHTALAAGTFPEANAVNAKGVVHVPVEEVNGNMRGPSEGDTDDEAHTADVEAALLAVSSPGRETHTEDAGPVETGVPSAAATKAEV